MYAAVGMRFELLETALIMYSIHHWRYPMSFSMPARFTVRLLSLTLLVAGTTFSQVVLDKESVLKIFTPGGLHYYTPGTGGNFDIGRPGGPHVYDFSSINLTDLSISYNYDVSTIPELEPRYPAGCVTMGETPATIEKNPVFHFDTDTMYVVGQATLSPEMRFAHSTPWEIVAVFPTVYGSTFTQMVEERETTYTSGGAVQNVNLSSSEEVTAIDGFGTLKLSIGEFPCLRIRKEHRGYGDKEFMFLTQEGVFLGIGSVALEVPDSGVVSGGMQVLLAASLVGVEDGAPLPAAFSLSQNYPNPFNPSTEIEFQVAAFGRARLAVYDLLGREVSLLVDGTLDPGLHTVRFDAANLASGVYIYRLATQGHTATRTMLLMR